MTSKTPYITVNALIRYCLAKAPQRSRIIRDFRDTEFPPFKGWYGGETEGAIRRYLATGGTDTEPLDSLERTLVKREAATDHEEDKIQGQLHALEATRSIDLSTITKYGAPDFVSDVVVGPFFIGGVRVSVRPTNLLRAEKDGQKALAIGAIKPYLASSEPMSPESGLLYASLLHWFVEANMQHLGAADRRLSFVIDVFAGKVFQAPLAFKQRRDLILHSCHEIYDRWYVASGPASEVKKA